MMEEQTAIGKDKINIGMAMIESTVNTLFYKVCQIYIVLLQGFAKFTSQYEGTERFKLRCKILKNITITNDP